MNSIPILKITSPGAPWEAVVTLDGVPLPGVLSISMDCSATSPSIATIKMEVIPDFEMPTNVTVQQVDR